MQTRHTRETWAKTARHAVCGRVQRGAVDGPTDLLVPLLPTAVGDDGRVDEGALGGHVLTQQAFHLLWPEAGGEVQQFHTPVVSNGTKIRQRPC